MHESYKKWIDDGKPKIFCQCICNKEIIIKEHHKHKGIPKYIRGHSNYSIEIIEKNRLANSGKNNHFYGKHHSEENKIKIGCGNRNKKFSEERKKNMSISHKRENLSQESLENMSKGNSGENNGRWNGGTSYLPYCEKFNEKLKEKIRIRDNRICQECGKTELKNGRKLDVHHIHYDKPNCDPDLIALCVSCNAKSNSNRNYWEEHFMEKLKGEC